MKKYFPLFLVALVTLTLAACGSTVPTKTVAMDLLQEATFRSLGGQSNTSEVHLIFTEVIPGFPGQNAVMYGQVFLDDQLMDGITSLPEGNFDVLPGLTIYANGFTQQLVIKYDPKLWEVMP